MKCSKCGTINDHEAVYCGNCGEFILEGKKLCYECNSAVEYKEDYCPTCRTYLKAGFHICRKCGKENSLEHNYCTGCKVKIKSNRVVNVSIVMYSIIIYAILQVSLFITMFIDTEIDFGYSWDELYLDVNILNHSYWIPYMVMFIILIGLLLYCSLLIKTVINNARRNFMGEISKIDRKKMKWIIFFVFILVCSVFFLEFLLLVIEYQKTYNGSLEYAYFGYVGLQLPKMIMSFTLLLLFPISGIVAGIAKYIKTNIAK